MASEQAKSAAGPKRVLLVIGGGISAYKSLELVRELQKRGVASRAILTHAGSQFVTPMSLAALTRDRVHQELFDLTGEAEIGHIELSRSADLVVVAPATADLMAKAAHGLANDLASTALLATDKPVLMAPAMNVRMWEHAATMANLKLLRERGIAFVGPDSGAMACGEFGPGRMAEPAAIADRVMAMLGERAGGAERVLKGRRVLVTAGPTVESIDPVRIISNRSSGKQGYAVAAALAELGAEVTLVSGPTALGDVPGVTMVRIESAREMLAACEAALPVEAAVCVAAVADWRPAEQRALKLDKEAAGSSLALVPNPDILATISKHAKRPKLVVGFAAQTHEVEQFAQAKLARKGCDWIVANDVSGDVLGGDANQVSIISAGGVDRLARMPKTQVAAEIARRIAVRLNG